MAIISKEVYIERQKKELFLFSCMQFERKSVNLQPNSIFGKYILMRKKVFIILWILLFLTIGGICLAFWSIARGYIGYMPELKQLENPVNKFA